jgi:Family of unknown function (DUF5678)
MAASTIDYADLLEGLPAGAWVAISEEKRRVVAFSGELQAALDQAHACGELDPLIVRVPEQAMTLFL